MASHTCVTGAPVTQFLRIYPKLITADVSNVYYSKEKIITLAVNCEKLKHWTVELSQ